jgi:hypothetical protein
MFKFDADVADLPGGQYDVFVFFLLETRESKFSKLAGACK